MRAYQERYIENIKEIDALRNIFTHAHAPFPEWQESRIRARERMRLLKEENLALLFDNLFPALDCLHEAGEEELSSLAEFAEALMDGSTNLDCGIYILIHDALLSLARFHRDVDGTIRELYKLGMGLYYQNRSVIGVENETANSLRFQDEMAFTEAGSYIRFFEEFGNDETKGYIIRSLANIAVSTKNTRKRIATSARVLEIVQDEAYRACAPSLPWDRFLRLTYQQMSSNRHIMSKGDLSKEELSEVLFACQVVFQPEADNDKPNVRWLWPYYEMEYSCGFVDLKTTLLRMEKLISRAKFDEYDPSGLYANVQLPIYYGKLMAENPELQKKPRHVYFLREAYQKMMRTLLTYPVEALNDYLMYYVNLVVTDYLEIEGVASYREVTACLMQRYTGEQYVTSCLVGEAASLICRAIISEDAHFFDDIPFIKECPEEEKEKRLMDYARDCGIYHDFGLLKLNMSRFLWMRTMFEQEERIYQLHTLCASEDLRERPSTAHFADIALGHHRWYNGSGGYPESYERNRSPYRQMTDVIALSDALCGYYKGDIKEAAEKVQKLSHKQFSPMAAASLSDEALLKELEALMQKGPSSIYREIYDSIHGITL